VHSLATLSDVRRVPPAQRARIRADAIACPVEFVTRASPDEQLVVVARRSTGTAGGRVLVFDGDELVGIVSPSDVARATRERETASPHDVAIARRPGSAGTRPDQRATKPPSIAMAWPVTKLA
jgi:hypothetical protein